MTKDAKSIAIGVFVALVAFRLFELVWRELDLGLPVLLVLVLVAVAVYALTNSGKLRTRAKARR